MRFIILPPKPVSPSGTIASATPAFQWDKLSGGDQVRVRDLGRRRAPHEVRTHHPVVCVRPGPAHQRAPHLEGPRQQRGRQGRLEQGRRVHRGAGSALTHDHRERPRQDLRRCAPARQQRLHDRRPAARRLRGVGDAVQHRCGRRRHRERLAVRDRAERRRRHGARQVRDHVRERQPDGGPSERSRSAAPSPATSSTTAPPPRRSTSAAPASAASSPATASRSTAPATRPTSTARASAPTSP